MNANENLPPSVIIRLMKEIQSLCVEPPEGIRVSFSEDNISNITAEIDGPVDTPFEGGLFKVKLVLGADFPEAPPKGWFLTKVFHPNVAETGEICVNTLKKDWKPTHGLEHVLLVIRCLLIVPNPESALNPEAGRLLLDDFDDFARRARLMTRIHAKPSSSDAADDGPCATSGAESGDGSSRGTGVDAGSVDGNSSPKKNLKSAGAGKAKTKAKGNTKKKGLRRL